jgi:hypothetical protein
MTPGWIAAAAFLLVVLGGAIVAVLVLPSSNVPSAPATTRPVVAPCTPSGSAAIPDAAPPATWTLTGTVAAPTSPSAGPSRIDQDGFRHCFAHTPTGALFAAANYIAMASGDHDLAVQVAEHGVADGLGKSLAVQAAKTAGDGSSATIQIAGFQVVTYDPSLASVKLAVRTDAGTLASGVVTLRWQDADWRMVADPSTGQTSSVQPIESLGGYVPWGAN